MRRHQLVELEDLPGCPRAMRDGGTDWLRAMMNWTNVFASAAPKLREVMRATGTSRVVDLCSGGGGPWLTLERELAKSGPIEVVLTDLYPNRDAFDFCRKDSGDRIRFREQSIDATDVPPDLEGVRTLFNAFHHFPPDTARAILADAVKKQQGIAIFEVAGRRAMGLVAMPAQLLAIVVLTPFVRPFRWSRLLLTYVLPVIPFIVAFDGVVSFLRLYLEDDLRALVDSVPGHERFTWEIGVTTVGRLPVGPLYLIGIPRRS